MGVEGSEGLVSSLLHYFYSRSFFYCYLTVVISLQGIFVLFIISKLGYEKREDIYFYDNKIFNYSKGNYRFVT